MVWLNDRARADMSDIAVSSYLELIDKHLSGSARFSFAEDFSLDSRVLSLLRRSIVISRATKAKNELPRKIGILAKTIFDAAIILPDVSTLSDSLDIQIRYRVLEDEYIIENIRSTIEELKTEDMYWAKNLLKQVRVICLRNNNTEEANNCLRQQAELSVKFADKSTGSATNSAFHLMEAISQYQRVGGLESKAIVRELRLRLIGVQEASTFEMNSFSQEVDLSKPILETEEKFVRLEIGAALRSFAFIWGSSEPDALYKYAEELDRKYPLSAMTDSVYTDERGRITARFDHAGRIDSDGKKEALLESVIRHQNQARWFGVKGFIEPARRVISIINRPKLGHFRILATQSRFVPPFHRETFALGLHRYFQGDAISASSILIPQLENSLRYTLEIAGIFTATIESDGTQKDRSLATLLENHHDGLAEIYGDALIFEIDLLFNKRPGPALRHEQAHGKMSDGDFYGEDANFACWLTFKLVCISSSRAWEDVAADLRRI